MAKDLTHGTDCRGDEALFIEDKHIIGDGWQLDQEAQEAVSRTPQFFRVIDSEGEEQHGHGWIDHAEDDSEDEYRIVQWG